MRWQPLLCVALLTPSLSPPCSSQVRGNPDSSAIRVSSPESDSSQYAPLSPLPQFSHTKIDTVQSGFHQTKSPGVAMLLSALLPGAGQVYNRSYWKVPIIAGLGVYFASVWLEQNRLYKQARDVYSASLTANPPINQGLLDDQKGRRDFYRDQRDTFAWYFAILYFVNIADAYVDASLYDFNVSGDLSLRVLPESPFLLGLQVKF